MKCKYCGFEAPVISRELEEPEFITAIENENGIEPILVCPKCGKEQ